MKIKTIKKVPETELTGGAREHWEKVLPPLVASGVVKEVDIPLLEAACKLYSQFEEEGEIAPLKAYLTIMEKFGVTEKGRSSLKMKKEEKKENRAKKVEEAFSDRNRKKDSEGV